MSIIFSVVVCLVLTRTHGLLVEEFDVEARFNAMSLEIQQLKQSVQSLQAQNAVGPIAFNAVLSATLPVLGSHQHIVFDSVLTNVGNAYSPLHGHFTAPVKGVYAFFVTLTNIPQHSVSAKLIKNGAGLSNVLAHGTTSDSGLFVTSTIATMVQLDIGDQVWVQNEYAFTTVEELDGNWSYFSGHLIGTM